MPLPSPQIALNTASMNAMDEKSGQVYEQFTEMCYDLNMDKMTAREAWHSYRQVKQNYSLEVSIKNILLSLLCVQVIMPLKTKVMIVGAAFVFPLFYPSDDHRYHFYRNRLTSTSAALALKFSCFG